MQKTEIVCGLPWLHTKPERAIFSELGFACVYAVGPSGGRPLRIGWSKQLKDRMQELQLGCWKELQIHDIAWTAGDMLAIRLFNEAVGLLDKAKRRLTGDWFDVTPEFAQQALRVATDKTNIPTFSHVQMLDKVRDVRKKRIEAAIRNA
ncbi:hypothetical protein [Bradyrhizobium ottawaense]|uniref:GIY-YIG nuclease family protein n=1 Tax=Bradyrhizobium ottawaense TaxID=931866 RepID=A0ABY0QHD4_9BRAD|nr:hypothetical protein [Bradyrhizobium ottawaense]SDK44098.1 hypothetical protein SAMN05444163_8118 [Bradyrhizobium ottawaense]